MENSPAPWFKEQGLPYGRPGVEIAIQVEETLLDTQSAYSHIQVFNTPFYGKMLVIDGIIQTTESDEFIYHEMMVIAPCLQFGHPRSMLIIGGGDGGAAKQALRIKSLEKIVQVEIDAGVIEASEKYMPSVSEGSMRNPKVQLIVDDGAKFIAETKDKFDIVVLDLTDPVPDSPAESLFGEPFYQSVRSILNDGGVVAVQSGSLLFQPEEAPTIQKRLANVFGHALIRAAVVPGYQLSLFGFQYASATNPEELDRGEVEKRLQNITGENKYLNTEVFLASTAIPPCFLGNPQDQ